MKFISSIITFFCFFFVVFLLYQFFLPPCTKPLAYSIGTIDPRHNISEERFRTLLERGEAVWEASLQKDLFSYSSRGTLTVNLLFDERQEMRSVLKEKEQSLDAKEKAIQNERETISRLRKELFEKETIFKEALDLWNKGPRTSRQTFNKLKQNERELADLSTYLNKRIDEYNKTVRDFNLAVTNFNHNAGEEEQAGEARGGNVINLYLLDKNEDDVYLVAHELGHAIGIAEHATTSHSLMYYRLPENITGVSDEDVRLMKKACLF